MIFNAAITLRGRPIISWIEKDKRSNRINVELDRFGNKLVLSFDSICFQSSVLALSEYMEKGELSYSPSEACQSQCYLDRFFLDLSKDKRFSVMFYLDDLPENCGLIIRSDHVQISFCFNSDQIIKIVEKFNNAIKAKEALGKAEKEIIL